MSRLKMSSSQTFSKAITRLAALTSIDKNMDLGNGLTNNMYEIAIADLRATIDDYNTALSLIDEKRNIVLEKEAIVRDLTERMLTGVGSKFGKNSNEYEKAGGAKKSEIKHSRRSPLKKAG